MRSWLCGILKHKICDYHRKLGRETSFVDLEFLANECAEKFVPEGYWVHMNGPKEWEQEPDEVIHRHEFWKTTRDCLGKLPERAQRTMALNKRMRALTENLQKAVADENYESAASLRDQIKQLETDLSNSG